MNKHLLLPSGAVLQIVAMLGGLLALPGCKSKLPPPLPKPKDTISEPGGDWPVSNGRLKGARLDAIQSTTRWDFTDTRFTLVNRSGPLPVNVAASIFGPGAAASRVVGNWRFDEKAGVMILSEMEKDGQKVDATVSLPIHPAGMVRVNFGTEQYNIYTRDEVKRLEPEPAPPPIQR